MVSADADVAHECGMVGEGLGFAEKKIQRSGKGGGFFSWKMM